MSNLNVDESARLKIISDKLRDWIHDSNNALFVTKGFMEEICSELQDRTYFNNPDFDHDALWEMLQTVLKNVERLETDLSQLRKYAREDIFTDFGIIAS